MAQTIGTTYFGALAADIEFNNLYWYVVGRPDMLARLARDFGTPAECIEAREVAEQASKDWSDATIVCGQSDRPAFVMRHTLCEILTARGEIDNAIRLEHAEL